MRAFSDIPSFLAFLVEAHAEMKEAEHHGLEAAAVVIEKDAKASLGEYQQGVGPFPAWPELAESTQEQRAKAGYSANDPLLRSKTLEGAITHDVHAAFALVGVPETGELEPDGNALVSDVAKDMEWGTMRAPPRPFMGPAAYRKGKEAAEAAGAPIISKLVGREVSPSDIKATRTGGNT